MFFGSQVYPEGRYKPQRGSGSNWHVWDETGALEVINKKEYPEWLKNYPEASYTINFANGSCARIFPAHPLWCALAEITKEYTVEVFQLTLKGGYVPWTGADKDLRCFDGISVSLKR